MQRRGTSDRLSPADLDSLVRDLSSYIVKAQQEGKQLWNFGAYGEESPKHVATRGKAPFIPDFLENFDLWLFFHQVLCARKSFETLACRKRSCVAWVDQWYERDEVPRQPLPSMVHKGSTHVAFPFSRAEALSSQVRVQGWASAFW